MLEERNKIMKKQEVLLAAEQFDKKELLTSFENLKTYNGQLKD